MPTSQDLARFRSQLLARRAELRQQLSSLTADQRREPEALSADFEEQAIQRENDEVVDALQEGALAELRAIGQAMDRLETGTYGRCTRCGGTIEAKRLQALPHTSHCSQCATAAAS